MKTMDYYNKLVHIQNKLSKLGDSTCHDDEYVDYAINNIATDIGNVKEDIIHQEAKKYRKLKGNSFREKERSFNKELDKDAKKYSKRAKENHKNF